MGRGLVHLKVLYDHYRGENPSDEDLFDCDISDIIET